MLPVARVPNCPRVEARAAKQSGLHHLHDVRRLFTRCHQSDLHLTLTVSPLLHLSRLPSAHLEPSTGRSTHQHPLELPLPHSSTSSLHGPLPLVSRHRQTDTTPRKAGHMSRIQQHNKKCALKFWRTDAHKPRTALCSTVLARSDTATVAWSIPWPVSGHSGWTHVDARCLPRSKKKIP